MKLDGFQRLAVHNVLRDIEADRRALLVAPTGAGKTVMMAAVLRILQSRDRLHILVLQHTTPLLRQNYRELEALCGALDFDVAMLGAGRVGSDVRMTGKRVKIGAADIVVATVQTFKREWADLLRPFDVVVVDEAHHAVSPEYTEVLNQIIARNPAVRILGMTATPERADGKGLVSVFPRLTHQVSIEDVVTCGRVVPARVLEARVQSLGDLSGHAWSDADDDTISVRLRGRVTMAEMVRQHRALSGGRTSVYFCADTAHAEALAEVFGEEGFRAASVSHRTGRRDLADVLERLAAGELDVVTNPVMLTEGFNAPRVSLIGLARGFASKSLAVQAVGRGMRGKVPGKTDCLVLDFVAALERHGNLLAGTDIQGRIPQDSRALGTGAPQERREYDLVDAVIMQEVEAFECRLSGITVTGNGAPDAAHQDDGDQPARSQKEALARGVTMYLAAPCRDCGKLRRYAANGACAFCKNERQKKRYRAEPMLRQKSAERSWRDYRNPKSVTDAEWRKRKERKEAARRLRESEYKNLRGAAS